MLVLAHRHENLALINDHDLFSNSILSFSRAVLVCFNNPENSFSESAVEFDRTFFQLIGKLRKIMPFPLDKFVQKHSIPHCTNVLNDFEANLSHKAHKFAHHVFCPIRSNRPIHCSNKSGFVGKSNNTKFAAN